MTLLGIGGVGDDLEGLSVLTQKLSEFLSQSSIGEILATLFSKILTLYTSLVDIAFFFMPDKFFYKEFSALLLIVLSPQALRIKKGFDWLELCRESEFRFAMSLVAIYICVAFHEAQFGQTGVSISLVLSIFFPTILYLLFTLAFRLWSDTLDSIYLRKPWWFIGGSSLLFAAFSMKRDFVSKGGPTDNDFWFLMTAGIVVLVTYLFMERRIQYLNNLPDNEEPKLNKYEKASIRVMAFTFLNLWRLAILGLGLFFAYQILVTIFSF